jgi:hypothetical protein
MHDILIKDYLFLLFGQENKITDIKKMKNDNFHLYLLYHNEIIVIIEQIIQNNNDFR